MNSSVLSVQFVTSSVGVSASAARPPATCRAAGRRQRRRPARARSSRASSWNLPSADEFEFDLGLPHGGVERRLPHARRRAGAIGIEQFEDAALAGVVADLRDPLDLIGAVDRRGAIAVGGCRAARRRRARSAAICARSVSAERLGSRLGLSGPRLRPARARAARDRTAESTACTAMTLPTSPPPAVDDFVPATISGSGIQPPVGGPLGEAAPLRSRAAAPAARRASISARSTSASTGGSGGRRRRRRPTATMLRRIGGVGEEAASVACARARSVAAAARSASMSSTSRSARSRSKPAASPAASRLASTSASSRRRSRAAVSSRSRACAATSSANASRRSARSRRTSSSARLALASTSADAALHLEAAPPGDRQRLRHHRDVLGDAGDRLAVEGDARIRPAAGRQHVGAGDVDRRRGSRARADCRRTAAPGPRIRSASTIERPRSTADSERRERGAEHHSAHNTSNDNGKGDRRRTCRQMTRKGVWGGPRSESTGPRRPVCGSGVDTLNCNPADRIEGSYRPGSSEQRGRADRNPGCCSATRSSTPRRPRLATIQRRRDGQRRHARGATCARDAHPRDASVPTAAPTTGRGTAPERGRRSPRGAARTRF